MSTRRRVGRPRRTACIDPHVPGETCRRCAREWQRSWRARGPAADQHRDRHRDNLEIADDRARAYVSSYLRRGRITPPKTCERCGRPTALVFWHPNAGEQREILWLCPRDRKIVASLGEPVTLTWVWPGTSTTPTAASRVRHPNRMLYEGRYIQHPPAQPIEEPAEPQAAPPDSTTTHVAASNTSDERYPWPIDRAGAEAWLATLTPSDAETFRIRAATVRGIHFSRESPLYSQQIVRLYGRAKTEAATTEVAT